MTKRIYLKQSRVVVDAKGIKRQYRAPGFFNAPTELAAEWCEDPAIAVPVDANDVPIEPDPEPLAPVVGSLSEVSEEADIIIILSHLGMEVDLQMAGEVQGIDLIVGGKSRDVLHPPLWDEPSRTVIAQAGYQGQRIGVVSLDIVSQGTVDSHRGEVVVLTDEFADDPEMKAFLDQYK